VGRAWTERRLIAALLARALRDGRRPAAPLRPHGASPAAARRGRSARETTIERAGRTVTNTSARLVQGGKLQAIALAAFARTGASAEMHHALPPEVAPPEACPVRGGSGIPIHERFEQRFAIGPLPMAGPRSREARTGGWLRLVEPRPLDAALLVAYADVWPPSVFTTDEIPPVLGGVPTVDLTVHVRTPLPARDVGPEDAVLVSFRTREVGQGLLEETARSGARVYFLSRTPPARRAALA
jgi:hypothetical protein